VRRLPIRAVTAALTATAVSACSGGSGGGNAPSDPPPPVEATVTGAVFVSDVVTSGTVSAYDFSKGKQGALIASSPVGSDGSYSLSVPANQAVELVLTGGCYSEYATSKSTHALQTAAVCMAGNDMMRALVVPQAAGAHAAITPFTEAATALASYLIASGQSTLSAIDSGNQRWTAITGVDVLATDPAISDDKVVLPPLDSPHTYGMLLDGMASWVVSAAEGDGKSFGTLPYTTMQLTQLMSADINADGVLDGAGSSTLKLGSVALSATVYRHEVSVYAVWQDRYATYGNPNPQYPSVSVPDCPLQIAAIQQYNDSTDPIFGAATVVPLDEGGPVMTQNTLLTVHTGSQEYAISFNLDDVVGVVETRGSIEILVDGAYYDAIGAFWYLGTVNQGGVNTTVFPNGNHTITVRATDCLNNSVQQSGVVNFQN
jgi:hypothetical protein